MIDEKKLIEELREKYFNCNLNLLQYQQDDKMRDSDYALVYMAKLIGLRDAISIAKEQPEISEWIPCSERLPEGDDYELVLVWLEATKTMDLAVWHYKHGFRPWYSAYFEDCPPEWEHEVTAWMPAPIPPKGDKDE